MTSFLDQHFFIDIDGRDPISDTQCDTQPLEKPLKDV